MQSAEGKSESRQAKEGPRSWLWIIALVVFVAVTNSLSGRSSRKPPGELRGDIRLERDALPQEMEGWKLVQFIPPDAADNLRDGQWWWSHQWIYSRGNTTAIVSLDQLGWNQWHELTSCYVNFDWEIVQRSVVTQDALISVCTEMKRKTGERGFLAFTEFFEDGTCLQPPYADMTRLNKPVADRGVLENFRDRFLPVLSGTENPSGHSRMLQSQVFVVLPTPGTDVEQTEFVEPIMALHRMTTSRFKDLWLQHQQKTATSPTQP